MPRLKCNIYLATAIQVMAVLAILWALRFVFIAFNEAKFPDIDAAYMLRLARAGLRFDVSANATFNALFIILRFLPLKVTANRHYLLVTNILFCLSNALMLLPALADIPIYAEAGTRMSPHMLRAFLLEPNIGGIMASFVGSYWWVFLSGLAILLILGGLVYFIRPVPPRLLFKPKWRDFAFRTVIFAGATFLTFLGIRGRSPGETPLVVEYASWHARRQADVNIILNTPFILTRIEDDSYLPHYRFFTPGELATMRNSVHIPADTVVASGKNIVVITIESGGSLWHRQLDVLGNPPTEGLAPFLDSLLEESLAVEHVMATSTLTVDGIRNIYGGFPAYGFFFLANSPFEQNRIDGLASVLGRGGYDTKFYFGGWSGSFALRDFLISSGFSDVTDASTLPDIPGSNDGVWGYWDHALARYAAADMGRLKTPFLAGLLTLNPHVPYKTPADWGGEYRYPEGSYERAVEYLDKSLALFFEEAKKQPWYDDTIFIITADHGARYALDTFRGTSYVQPHILFAVFDPSGETPGGLLRKTMGQVDIMPTILALAGNRQPFVAFGEDIMSERHPGYAFSMIADVPQVASNRYLVRLDPLLERVEAVYDVKTDKLLHHPLGEYDREEVERMVKWAQALNQDFSERMYADRMHYQ